MAPSVSQCWMALQLLQGLDSQKPVRVLQMSEPVQIAKQPPEARLMPEAAIPMPTLAAASAPLLPPQPAAPTNVRSASVYVRVNGLPPPAVRMLHGQNTL